ncbi:MAG: diguanylate cyclase, partial [Rhodanobacter sp.]|nr:diguanylate cyclase [Rhodanobacter sp.]
EDARRVDYPEAEANFLYCRGSHQEGLTTSRDALSDYTAGIEIARHIENPSLVADGLTMRGTVQSLIGEPALALVDFLQAQRNYEGAGETVLTQLNLLNIAVAYRRIGEFDKARQYMEQSLAHARQRRDVPEQILIEVQLGYLDSDLSNQTSAHRHFAASLALARGIGDPDFLGSSHLGQANTFNLEGRHAQALDALKQAQAAFSKVADHSSQDMIALQTAEAEAGLGHHAEAVTEYGKAEQLLAPSGNLRYMVELLDARARSYEALGNQEQAVHDLHREIRMRETLESNARRYNTTLMSYQFDSARRDQEDRRIKEESALQGRQLAALKRARDWQNLAMLLGSLLLLGLIWQAVRQLRHSRRLHALAMTDALTGIANRRRIEQVMSDVMREARQNSEQMTVIVLDIDHFKRINDLHGHQVGDIVLVRLVVACNNALRGFDHLGRFGGEEFLVILPKTGLETGRVIAERLRERVIALDLGDIASDLKVTISLGVAQLDDPAEPMDSLVERADRALYQAKAAGRNRVELAESPASP